MIEMIHIPLHIHGFLRGTFHPVLSLCIMLLLIGMWSWFSFALFAQAPGVWIETPAFIGLCDFGGALSAVNGVLYVVYTGFACAAVHRHRKQKTAMQNKLVTLHRPIELDSINEQLVPSSRRASTPSLLPPPPYGEFNSEETRRYDTNQIVTAGSSSQAPTEKLDV